MPFLSIRLVDEKTLLIYHKNQTMLFSSVSMFWIWKTYFFNIWWLLPNNLKCKTLEPWTLQIVCFFVFWTCILLIQSLLKRSIEIKRDRSLRFNFFLTCLQNASLLSIKQKTWCSQFKCQFTVIGMNWNVIAEMWCHCFKMSSG